MDPLDVLDGLECAASGGQPASSSASSSVAPVTPLKRARQEAVARVKFEKEELLYQDGSPAAGSLMPLSPPCKCEPPDSETKAIASLGETEDADEDC